jgi:hypothetical protein
MVAVAVYSLMLARALGEGVDAPVCERADGAAVVEDEISAGAGDTIQCVSILSRARQFDWAS